MSNDTANLHGNLFSCRLLWEGYDNTVQPIGTHYAAHVCSAICRNYLNLKIIVGREFQGGTFVELQQFPSKNDSRTAAM